MARETERDKNKERPETERAPEEPRKEAPKEDRFKETLERGAASRDDGTRDRVSRYGTQYQNRFREPEPEETSPPIQNADPALPEREWQPEQSGQEEHEEEDSALQEKPDSADSNATKGRRYKETMEKQPFLREEKASEKDGRETKNATKYRQRFEESAREEDLTAGGKKKAAESGQTKRASKLAFTEEEIPVGSKIKAGTSEQRKKSTDTGQASKLKTDPKKGQTRLKEGTPGKKSETADKDVSSKNVSSVRRAAAAAGVAAAYAHRAISSVDDDNIGTQAAHRTEMAGENSARTVYRTVRSTSSRRAARVSEQSARAAARDAYQSARTTQRTAYQAVRSGAARSGKSAASGRAWQMRRAQRRYANAVRSSGRTARMAERTARRTASGARRAGSAAGRAAASHPIVTVIIVVAFIIVLLIIALFSSCTGFSGAAIDIFSAAAYVADDEDIDQAELAYTEWEADLQLRINGIESEYPGYDEYRYQIDAIEHDPFQLMGFLTAVYEDFTFSEVEGVLREIFNEQYTLAISETTETRTRTEMQIDSDTGEEIEVEVEYEWHILNVSLTNNGFAYQIVARMDEDQKDICELLLETKGYRYYVENIFGDNWLPYVTGYYGWRASDGGKTLHTGVDISIGSGKAMLAGLDGIVTQAGQDGDGNLTVVIEGDTGTGYSLVTRYVNCSEVLVSVGQAVTVGDAVAKSGSTVHFEVLVDGEYRNPLYFADTGDTNAVTLPTISSGGSSGGFHYDIPSEALSDERFAAMIAEAEKYLGYPYVWGGSSPETSFDCSGFVSWVLNHSGWSVGRLTANELCNYCTPVSKEEAKPGDLIFFQGTYNTTGASHVGIYVGDGMMIHCGNPIQYASINTSYWQEHFYTFGRLP